MAIGKEDKIGELKVDWITFFNKDQAKELGAKWNPKQKYWYVSQDISTENMEKLKDLKPKDEEIKLDWITYSNKDKAKSYGAMWNHKKKYWYAISSTPKEKIDKLFEMRNSKSIN